MFFMIGYVQDGKAPNSIFIHVFTSNEQSVFLENNFLELFFVFFRISKKHDFGFRTLSYHKLELKEYHNVRKL